MKQRDGTDLLSWGRVPARVRQSSVDLDARALLPKSDRMLPRGEGRSYGDSCVNDDGVLLLTQQMNCLLGFDQTTGVLRAQAGVSLDEILKVFVPKGWFLPVTPGTKFVTLGGAIANDVHGKNHHRAGNFGNHIRAFELRRSDGALLYCSPESNPEMFRATIGGCGLTGLITWADVQLIPIQSAYIDQEQIKFSTLREFLELSRESESLFDYTVAWVDCVNGADLRGIFIRGNHAIAGGLTAHRDPTLLVPISFPSWVLNQFSIALFNILYFAKNLKKKSRSRVHYDSFFYPLDAIHHWNRIYGKRGFYQYQFVVPVGEKGEAVLAEILRKVKKSGMASFLVVLKTFGGIQSPGLMSFPREGITLALDFANYGEPLLRLLDECDALVASVGGRLYPAKDARMSSEFFASSYPKDAFQPYKDANFSSGFSRRVRL